MGRSAPACHEQPDSTLLPCDEGAAIGSRSGFGTDPVGQRERLGPSPGKVREKSALSCRGYERIELRDDMLNDRWQAIIGYVKHSSERWSRIKVAYRAIEEFALLS